MAKFWLLLKIGQNVTFLRRKQKLALIFEKAKCGLQLIADGLIRNRVNLSNVRNDFKFLVITNLNRVVNYNLTRVIGSDCSVKCGTTTPPTILKLFT